MISDVISEAVEEIERYEREMPDVYSGVKDEIAEAKTAMLKLQRMLDAPPPAGADR